MTGKLQYAVALHGPQPVDAGGSLFHAADDLGDQSLPLGRRQLLRPRPHLRMHVVEPFQGHEDHGRDQIGAVVHRDVRLVLQGGDDVLVIGVVVFLADGEDGDAEVVDEAGGHVVLGAERVGGDQHHVGAAGLQRADQVGSLAGDVQAGRQAQAGQRFLLGEAFADAGQHRHVAVSPQDTFLALRREFGVLDVAPLFGRRGHGYSYQGLGRGVGLPSRNPFECQTFPLPL